MARKALIALAAAVLSFSACTPTDSNGTGGGVNDPDFAYKPVYTAPVGTVYSQDFFPLKAGTRSSLTATLTDTTSFASNGMSGGMPVNESGTNSQRTDYSGFVETLPARSLTLASGTTTLIPEATGLAASGGTLYIDTAFYEKTASAIKVRGRSSEGSPFAEDDFLYLKRPLKVGDTWSYGSTDSGITSKGRFYVTGMETVTAGGKTYQALRLDQEGKSSGTYEDDGGATSVTYEAHVHQTDWFVEGVGQVKQTWRSEGTSTRVTSNQNVQLTLGQSVVRNFTMEMTP